MVDGTTPQAHHRPCRLHVSLHLVDSSSTAPHLDKQRNLCVAEGAGQLLSGRSLTYAFDHLPGRTDTTDDAMAALLSSIKLVQDAAEPFNKMAETIKPVVNTFKDVGDVVGGVYDVSRQMPGSCQAMYAYLHTW